MLAVSSMEPNKACKVHSSVELLESGVGDSGDGLGLGAGVGSGDGGDGVGSGDGDDGVGSDGSDVSELDGTISCSKSTRGAISSGVPLEVMIPLSQFPQTLMPGTAFFKKHLPVLFTLVNVLQSGF